MKSVICGLIIIVSVSCESKTKNADVTAQTSDVASYTESDGYFIDVHDLEPGKVV